MEKCSWAVVWHSGKEELPAARRAIRLAVRRAQIFQAFLLGAPDLPVPTQGAPFQSEEAEYVCNEVLERDCAAGRDDNAVLAIWQFERCRSGIILAHIVPADDSHLAALDIGDSRDFLYRKYLADPNVDLHSVTGYNVFSKGVEYIFVEDHGETFCFLPTDLIKTKRGLVKANELDEMDELVLEEH